MLMLATQRIASARARSAHPNDVDRKRIERALEKRSRYRYVSPSVLPVTDGYRIESPCCSRNVDPDGGLVDVALIQFCDETRIWRLFRRDHDAGEWVHHAAYHRLPELLEFLNVDPDRQFWQ